MRKLTGALLACLFIGASVAPVSAQSGRSGQSEESTRSGSPAGSSEADQAVELADLPGLADLPDLADQSWRDQGRRVTTVSVDRHCETVITPAAEAAIEVERTERAAERAEAAAGEVADGGTTRTLWGPVPLPGRARPVETVETWASSEVVQNVMRRLSGYIDESDDLLGYEIDEPGERIVVVSADAPAAARHKAPVQAILDSAEAELVAELAQQSLAPVDDLDGRDRLAHVFDLARQTLMIPAAADVEVEFRPICRDGADDLVAVQQGVESFAWADDSIPAEFFMVVERELVDGLVVVTVAEADEVAEAARALLHEAFGDDVQMVVDPEHPIVAAEHQVTDATSVAGATWQPGRYVDKSPHMGGVQVVNRAATAACTTGFAIDVDGGRSMLTAGHCEVDMSVPSWLYSGVHGRSRHRSYGAFYRSWFLKSPLIDVGLIGASNHTYRRKIYTDPDPSGVSERLVTAVWEPWVGASGVCFSGSFTGNRCTGKITHSSTACIRGGPVSQCGRLYIAESTDGHPLSRRGDSGGPVYLRSGSSRARAFGIIVNGLGNETAFVGSTAIYKTTGGWIAHRCCDASSVVKR